MTDTMYQLWCLYRLSIFYTHSEAVKTRHEAIMLQKNFLSSAPKVTYYTFKKMLIIPKIMPLILANIAVLAH